MLEIKWELEMFVWFLLLCFGAGFCLVLLENIHKGKVQDEKQKVDPIDKDSDNDDSIWNSKQLRKAAHFYFYLSVILGFLSFLTYASFLVYAFFTLKNYLSVFGIPVIFIPAILGIGCIICFVRSICLWFQCRREHRKES